MNIRLAYALTLGLVAGCDPTLPSTPIRQPEGLVVHEWGTYTSVQGSTGATLDGMQHEEEALPDFVISRAGEMGMPIDGGKGIEALPSPVNQKLETPVLYFYAPDTVEVEAAVDFPGGIVSQWYPRAETYSPTLGTLSAIADGHMRWRAQVTPSLADDVFRPVPEDSVWAPSRRTAAAPVLIDKEAEKFIFYRGLGRFDVPFRVEGGAGDTLDLVNDSDEAIADVFLLRVHEAGGTIVPLGAIPAHGTLRGVPSPASGKERNLDLYVDEAMATVASALERSGLYADEARAMVETWSRSYFRGTGLRVLYVTPRAWTDRLLPLSISPAPTALVRTLVGRVEVMTRSEEDAVLAMATSLGAGELVAKLGRFAEPKLRRALELTTSPTTIERIDAALAIAASAP